MVIVYSLHIDRQFSYEEISTRINVNLLCLPVEDPNDTGTFQLDQQEKEQQDKQDNTALIVSVKLLSDAQRPSATQPYRARATSNANGEVDLSQLSLGNILLRLATQIIYLSHDGVLMKKTQEFDVTLTPRSSSVKTLLFAGDTMFGDAS